MNLLLFLCVAFAVAAPADWKEPYFEKEDIVTSCEPDPGTPTSLTMKFKEDVPAGTVLGEFLYAGTEELYLEGPGVKFFNLNEKTLELSKTIDYEIEALRELKIYLPGDLKIAIKVEVENVNDNSIRIYGKTCEQEEKNKPEHVSTCEFTIEDPDGFSKDLKFGFEPKDRFKMSSEPDELTKEAATLKLVFLKEEDFETENALTFTWTAWDESYVDDNKETTVNLVKIIDLPDEEPIWDKIIGSISIDEEKTDTYTLSARDGDVGIHDEIIFMLDQERKGISIKDKTLSIGPFILDEKNENSITFDVIAQEKNKPNMKTPQTIYLQIKDINNNKPEITFDPTEEQIEFKEQSSDQIKTVITINDIDQGAFGTYKVELSSTALKTKDISSIMEIIPNTGYQKKDFSIIIKNPRALDYDTLETTLIDIVITAKDPDPNPATSKTLYLNLIDLNDEVPEWQDRSENYEILIDETFGRKGNPDGTIELPESVKFYAIDKDVDEKNNQISYTLDGAASKLLQLKKADAAGKNLILELTSTGTLPTQPFDFEREDTVYVTIEASDSLNKKPTQLTIRLKDVNDEAPHLLADKQTITIKEKPKDLPKNIGIKLTGTDADATNKLVYGIIDDKSYVLKKGVQTPWVKYTCISIDENTGALMLDKEPDYADYDTIYLQVYVEDQLAEFSKPQIDEVTLIINIENINDLDPIFDEDTFKGNKVVEKSETNTTIGVIKATDPDAPGWEDIQYSLSPEDGWVKIDSSNGILTVGTNTIDADITEDQPEGRKELKYKVTARLKSYEKGKYREAIHDLTIEIKDTNDKRPQIVMPSEKFFIDEHDADKKAFDLIEVTDLDRDDKYRLFKCTVGKSEDSKYYSIKTERLDGCLIEIDGENIDRELGKASHKIILVVTNYKDINDEGVQKEIEIEIRDINDHQPTIKPGLKFSAAENDKKGKVIGDIKGVDDDSDEKNSKITFTLTDVKSPDGKKKLDTKAFAIEPIEGETKNARIKLNRDDLKGFHGTFDLIFEAENIDGVPKLPPSKNNIVTLTVDKYNYEDVIFKDGIQDEMVILNKTQELSKPLKLWGSNEDLGNIVATDQQGDKYAIEFTIVDNPDDGCDLFKLVQQTDQQTQLQLKKLNGLDSCLLTVSAQSIGADPQGNVATIEINIKFLEDNAAPIFVENKVTCLDWKEEEMGSLYLKCDLPTATQFKPKTSRITFEKIKYVIKESVPDGAYAINADDNHSPKVEVVKPIDLADMDDGVKSYFIMEATYSDTPSDHPNSDSLCTVTVEIEDINNHAPSFKNKTGLGVLLIGNKKLDIQFEADDLDPEDELKYIIDYDEYKTNGTGLPGKETKPFKVKELNTRQSELVVDFTVEASMSGLISFDVVVMDSKEEPVHTASQHLELYVIADEQLCSIIFENRLDYIEENKQIVIKVLEEQFECKYEVGIDRIIPSQSTSRRRGTTYDESIGTTTTEVLVYFIDEEKREGIKNTVFKAQLNNYIFFDSMKRKFLEYNLVVDKVNDSSEVESLEETYKIALIAVASIFGILLIALIGFFTYKIRTTNSRLDRLDQAEARRPTMIPNLPGANRRATQVINPNITQVDEDEDNESNDYSFTQSPRQSKRDSIDDAEDDDENFVGVENSDIFKISN